MRLYFMLSLIAISILFSHCPAPEIDPTADPSAYSDAIDWSQNSKTATRQPGSTPAPTSGSGGGVSIRVAGFRTIPASSNITSANTYGSPGTSFNVNAGDTVEIDLEATGTELLARIYFKVEGADHYYQVDYTPPVSFLTIRFKTPKNVKSGSIKFVIFGLGSGGTSSNEVETSVGVVKEGDPIPTTLTVPTETSTTISTVSTVSTTISQTTNSLTTTTTLAGLPDFENTMIGAIGTGNALIKNNFIVDFRINNLGNIASSTSYSIFLSADTIIDASNDYAIANSFTPVINPLDYYDGTIDVNAPFIGHGTFYIGMIIDPGNSEPESNESNNVTATFDVLTMNTGIIIFNVGQHDGSFGANHGPVCSSEHINQQYMGSQALPFLSTSVFPISNIPAPPSIPVFGPLGIQISADYAGLWDSSLDDTLDNAGVLPPGGYYWYSGSGNNGSYYGISCNDWTDNTPGASSNLGISGYADANWIDAAGTGCDQMHYYLCVAY